MQNLPGIFHKQFRNEIFGTGTDAGKFLHVKCVRLFQNVAQNSLFCWVEKRRQSTEPKIYNMQKYRLKNR